MQFLQLQKAHERYATLVNGRERCVFQGGKSFEKRSSERGKMAKLQTHTWKCQMLQVMLRQQQLSSFVCETNTSPLLVFMTWRSVLTLMRLSSALLYQLIENKSIGLFWHQTKRNDYPSQPEFQSSVFKPNSNGQRPLLIDDGR